MRRRSLVLLAGLALLLLGSWWGARTLVGSDEPTQELAATHRKVGPRFQDALAKRRARGAAIPWTAWPRADGTVTIAGTVIDARTAAAVGGVEVVFRGVAGEDSTTSGSDGRYRLELPAGLYRAFVRDDSVLSVGRVDRTRIPGLPSVESANAPDEALMPLIVATADADGIDLSVMRGGLIKGHVVDRSGRPIAAAVLRAHGNFLRPTLGTDVAESDRDGSFEMQLPAGVYHLEATHAQFAGVHGGDRIVLGPGEIERANVTLTAGCVISGRVVAPGGGAANEGAIEQQWGEGDLQFAPSGRIDADGAFRWVTTSETEVVLRAWPWKSPPSPSQRFQCTDGARYEGVVFAIPDRGPDIEGVLLDHDGAPVPFAHVDLAPLDPGGMAQQERTDADGRWAVFHMPEGRYGITAFAPGRGVVSSVVSSPQTGVRLALSGTGRIEGTTTLVEHGSFELLLGACLDDTPIALPRDQRLVSVTGGRFTVDDVPACELRFVAIWRGKAVAGSVRVPANGAGHVELALDPPAGDDADEEGLDDSIH